MPNPQCLPATAVTTQTAVLHGTADNVPVGNKLRIDYSFISGGPYSTQGPADPGTNTPGQPITFNVTGLAPTTTYYYVVTETDAALNIVSQSAECSFTTLSYNLTCQVLSDEGVSPAVVKICADYVSDGTGGKAPQQLELVSAATEAGPYNTVEGSIAGTFTVGQCQTFTVPLGQCEIKFFKARVTPVPAEYQVHWQYAHGNRSGSPETAELRLGDQNTYPANQTLVDTDTVTTIANTPADWHLRQGVFPVPSGVTTLHMGFVSTGPPGSSVGNFIDDCSIVLERTVPGPPTIIGEQLQNPDFEQGASAPPPGSFGFVADGTTDPTMVWQTTEPDHLIEQWGTGFLGITSYSGTHHVELNANLPSELFQIVPLAVTFVESDQPCQAFAFDAVTICGPATEGTDVHHISVCGDLCAAPGYFWSFQYGECGAGFTHESPLVEITSAGIQNHCAVLGGVPCSACVQYRIVLYNPTFDPIKYGNVCEVATHDCGPIWCGGEYNTGDCTLVPTTWGGYYNCLGQDAIPIVP